jgi:hypothetical protein
LDVYRALIALAVALALMACGSSAGSVATQPPAEPTPEQAAFDISAVRANFTDECRDPAAVDELFCEQVRIDEMTGEGTILTVPTTLDAAADDRAYAICDQLVIAHFDGEGRDLGYEYVGVLDQDGGNAATCSVD